MVRPTSNESICVHRKSGVLVTLLHPIPDRQVMGWGTTADKAKSGQCVGRRGRAISDKGATVEAESTRVSVDTNSGEAFRGAFDAACEHIDDAVACNHML